MTALTYGYKMDAALPKIQSLEQSLEGEVWSLGVSFVHADTETHENKEKSE